MRRRRGIWSESGPVGWRRHFASSHESGESSAARFARVHRPATFRRILPPRRRCCTAYWICLRRYTPESDVLAEFTEQLAKSGDVPAAVVEELCTLLSRITTMTATSRTPPPVRAAPMPNVPPGFAHSSQTARPANPRPTPCRHTGRTSTRSPALSPPTRNTFQL